MAFKTIVLSDELPCRVRQLGLFELDGKGREVIGPYRYTMLSATGQFLEDEYVLPTDPADIPIKPDKPLNELTPEEQEELTAFETYQAALLHEQKRVESYEGYVNDIAAYILANCLDPADRNRLQNADDWDRVYSAAVIPQLTEKGVADTLRDTFPGFIWGIGGTGRLDAAERWQGQELGYTAMGTGNNQ